MQSLDTIQPLQSYRILTVFFRNCTKKLQREYVLHGLVSRARFRGRVPSGTESGTGQLRGRQLVGRLHGSPQGQGGRRERRGSGRPVGRERRLSTRGQFGLDLDEGLGSGQHIQDRGPARAEDKTIGKKYGYGTNPAVNTTEALNDHTIDIIMYNA